MDLHWRWYQPRHLRPCRRAAPLPLPRSSALSLWRGLYPLRRTVPAHPRQPLGSQPCRVCSLQDNRGESTGAHERGSDRVVESRRRRGCQIDARHAATADISGSVAVSRENRSLAASGFSSLPLQHLDRRDGCGQWDISIIIPHSIHIMYSLMHIFNPLCSTT